MGFLGKVVVAAAVVALILTMACTNKSRNMRYFETYDELSRKDVAGDGYEDKSMLPAEVLTPEGDDERSSRGIELAGDHQLARGNLAVAYVKYEKALKGEPGCARLMYKRGLALLLGRLEDQAIQAFKDVVAVDPEYALAYAGLGQAYFQKKNYIDARRCFSEAVSLNAGLWRSFLFLGVIDDYEGKHGQAIVEYSRAISIKDDKGSLYNNMGVSYIMMGRYEEAIEAIRMAIGKGYTEKRAYNNLGVALSKAGRYGEAVEAFREGGDLAQAYNNLGCVYLSQGDKVNARKSFRRAIQVKPTFYTRADQNLKTLEYSAEVE